MSTSSLPPRYGNGRLRNRDLVGRAGEVRAAIQAASDAVQGAAEALRHYANTEGVGGKVALADKRLAVLGTDGVSRTLLGVPDVRGYLLARAIIDQGAKTDDVASLAAAAAGLLTIGFGDESKRKVGAQAGLSKLKDPWDTFFHALVEEIVRRHNLSTIHRDPKGEDHDLTPEIIESLKADPPSLVGSAAAARVEEEISRAKNPANAALGRWINKGEVKSDLLDQPRVRQSMLDYLDRLGVDLSQATSRTTTKYDEYFALAFEHVSGTLRTADDPIQAKFTGTISEWDFSVDPLDGIEQQQVIAKNIRAAGALDYVFQLGERLGCYKLCDVLVLRWAHGALDIPDGEAADKLYRYWKLRDERSTPEERGLLYRRILARGPTQVLRGMVVNQEFPTLWGNLMEQVVDYIGKSESTRGDDRGPSTVRLTRATKQLQFNLTEHMTGMAQVQTAEIYAQLRDALDILADPQIVSILAGGRRQNLWTVIERVSREEFGLAINVEALRSVAVDGNRVFQWIADYVPGAEDTADFVDFLDAAESYIVAEASVHNDNASWLDEDDEDTEVPDEFEDFEDEFEDEFQNF